jgi:hypothetical protein
MVDTKNVIERRREALVASINDALTSAQEIMDRAKERKAYDLLALYEKRDLLNKQELAIGTGALLPEFKAQADAMAQTTGLNDTYQNVTEFCRDRGYKPAQVQGLIDSGELATSTPKRGSRRIFLVEDALIALATTKGGQRPLEDNVVRLVQREPSRVANGQ